MNENDVLDVEQSVQDDNVISEPSENDIEKEIDEVASSDPTDEQSEEEGSDAATEVYEVLEFPEYTIENPMPVMLVEEVEPETQLEVYALEGKYYGTISDTYLDYFEGIVEKLKPNEHYVIWRSGQYAYNMCYGENIELEGTYFSGDAESVTIFRDSDSYSNDWYVQYGSDNLALSATDLFVYSDLGMFPTVERGISSYEGMALLVAVGVSTVFVLCHSIFDYIVKYIYRR